MEQDLAALLAEGAAPAPTAPAATVPEIEKSKSDPDERIKGFQRLLAERETALETERRERAALAERLEKLELAQMSESERDSYLSNRRSTEADTLRAENELLKLRLKHPDVADHYDRLLKAGTAEEQIEYLRTLLKPKSAPVEAQESVSDVDPNRPLNPGFGLADADGYMDPEAAESALKRFGNRSWNNLRGR